MTRVAILVLLFTGTLVCAKPLASAVSLMDFYTSLLDFSSEVEEATTTETSDRDNDINSEPTENPWDCTGSSPNMIKCTLKTNTSKAEVVYFSSGSSKIAIPNKPPKGVALEHTDSKIDGSLEDFVNKMFDKTRGMMKSVFE